MNEPITISIPEAELELWLEHIKQGIEPTVKFSDDTPKMQTEAYNIRGNILYYLNIRLNTFLPNKM